MQLRDRLLIELGPTHHVERRKKLHRRDENTRRTARIRRRDIEATSREGRAAEIRETREEPVGLEVLAVSRRPEVFAEAEEGKIKADLVELRVLRDLFR
jgi:hypothetical protein